ncbi:MAG: hypothetical protein ABI609_01435 [Acidobacteriota bacterium]
MPVLPFHQTVPEDLLQRAIAAAQESGVQLSVGPSSKSLLEGRVVVHEPGPGAWRGFAHIVLDERATESLEMFIRQVSPCPKRSRA